MHHTRLTPLSSHTSLLLLLLLLNVAASAACRGEEDPCKTQRDCLGDERCDTSGRCVPQSDMTTGPATLPMIVSFGAAPTTPLVGQEVTLSWEIQGATSATIQAAPASFSYMIPASALAQGSTSLILTRNLTLTLSALNADGELATARLELIAEPVPIIPRPIIEHFSATPDQLQPGQSATLSWSIQDAKSATLRAGGVATPLSAAQLVSGELVVTPQDTTTYRLEAVNRGGTSTRSAQVVVNNRPPRIDAVLATPSSLTPGQSFTLSWRAVGVEQLTLEESGGANIPLPDGSLNQGELELTPTRTTTYIMVATNRSGRATSSVTVNVAPGSSIASFTSTPQTILSGENALLTWRVNGSPVSLSIHDDQSNPVDITGRPLAGGSISVSPARTTTYTLRAEAAQGQPVEALLTLEVIPDLPQITRLEADSRFVLPGGTATLSWEVRDAQTLQLQDGRGQNINLTGDDLSDGLIALVINQNTTYTLLATNVTGSTQQSLTIETGPVVSASLGAAPLTTIEGSPVLLSWTTMRATQLSLTSSQGDTFELGSYTMSADTIEVFPAAPSTTYTLSAEGFGGPAIAEITITPTPAARIQSFAASSLLIRPGDPVDLTWSIAHATAVQLDASSASGPRQLSPGAQLASGLVTDFPTETTTYTLRASGAQSNPATSALTVIVAPLPTITSFTATPDTITPSGSATLSWATRGASTITLINLNNGASLTYTDLGAGAGQRIVSPAATTSYLLRVENDADESANQVITVSVTP